MPSGLFYVNSLNRSISNIRDVWLFFYYYYEIPALNANSVGPDLTSRSAASDLGLHDLPKSLVRDARD